MGFARSTIRYVARRPSHEGLRRDLRELAEARPRYGYRKLCEQLQRRGAAVSRKLIWRLYREEGLKLRPRRKRKRQRTGAPLRPAVAPGERWALDFIHDSLLRGRRRLRVLSILDEASRECMALRPATSLGSSSVVAELDQLWQQGHKPRVLVMDNGPEFRSRAVALWAKAHNVHLAFTDPGRPTQNAFIESFHARFREECLDLHLFASINEAKQEIEAWKREYNVERPHSGIGGLTPAEYVQKYKAA